VLRTKKTAKKTAVKSAAKSAAKPTALATQNKSNVPQKTGGKENIPFIIRNNPKSLKIWENANEEERTAGLILSEFQTKTTKTAVSSYFELADKWNDAFPKSSKKLYDRGMEAVKKGARLTEMSATTVYSILRTTRFYGRAGYEALARKAEINGVIIYWTHLRIIAERLHGDKEARTKVEQVLVHKQLTENQLNELIEAILPDAKQAKAMPDQSQKEQTPFQRFTSMVSTFKNVASQRDKFVQVLEDLNNQYDGNEEQGRVILEQTSALISFFEEIQDFFTDQIEYVQQIQAAVQTVVDGANGKQKTKKSAEAIKDQIAHEKAEEQQKKAKRNAAAVSMGDLAGDVEISDSSYDEEDEEVETDDEMEEADDSYDGADEEADDEYADGDEESDDDDVNVDDDDDSGDIFDELGNIV